MYPPTLSSIEDAKTVLGKRIGGVWILYSLSERIGIKKTLGPNHEGRLALLQVIARIIDQGSLPS